MKNTLFEITKQEKNRILEMHKSATIKQYLMEGDIDSRKTILEILKVSDEITKKNNLDFSKFTADDKDMFMKVGDLQSTAGGTFMRLFGKNLFDSLDNLLQMSLDGITKQEKLKEFIYVVTETIKNNFSTDENGFLDLKADLENFNISLNKYELPK
jgi:hypothetical protein